MTNNSIRFLAFAAPAILLLHACFSAPDPAARNSAGSPNVGVLLFGDGGYHLNYPDQGDLVDLYSEEEYLNSERQAWVDDKRPAAEYQPRPMDVSPVTGKVVPATGLHSVSAAMRAFCATQERCDFGLMLGDNIYPSGLTFGADGLNDNDRLEAMFIKPYGSLVSQPSDYLSYVTLGNHDWETSREAGLAQVEFLENADGFYMDGPFYSVKPPAGKGEVELFVIDTSMLLASVTVYEDYLNDDGTEVVTDVVDLPDYHVEPLSEAERNMHQWLEAALRSSTAKWKIVVSHHPLWSSSGSKFEQGRALRRLLLPSMCRYADLLVVGHDHTLEVHTDDCSAALGSATKTPLVQIVSGVAGKQRPVNTNFMHHQEQKYPEHSTVWAKGLLWGFAFLRIEGNSAEVTFYSVPDDGSSVTSVEYAYRFERRSGQD